MSIPVIMVILYFILTVIISLVLTQRKANAEQYFVAKRSLGGFVVCVALFSESVAGATTVGNASSAFTSGISSVWASWGMGIGCFLVVLLVAKFYRSMSAHFGVMTVPEAYKYMFDNKTRIAMIINVVVVHIIATSTQARAASAIIAPLLGVDQNTVTWVMAAIFVLVVVTGGMKGIAKINVFHTAVMYIGVLFVTVGALREAGGVQALTTTLPSTYFSLGQPDWGTTLAGALGSAIGYLASSNVAGNIFSSKSLKSAKRGILAAGILIFPFAMCPAVIGLCAKVIMPDATASTILYTMAYHLGPAYAGIISMAILAAVLSTGPSVLMITTTAITRDLVKGYIRPNISDKGQVLFSRICAVVIAVVAVILGMNAGGLLNQLLGCFQIRAIAGIVLVVALFWPRVTSDATFWSLLVGTAIATFWQFSGKPFGVSPLWPAAAVSLVILVVMTLMSKEKQSPGYIAYKQAEAETLAKEAEMEKAAQ